ncbi:MAG: TonB family protein [Deltaproteobacteria bacterium]|nr:TonB family protein [Deltaproteobacteria bacterium]
MRRPWTLAWAVAIVAYLVLVGLALLPSSPPVEELPLVRMVFVEPPPPPALPLGAPGGAGTAAVVVEPVPAPAKVEPVPEPPQPVPVEPDRLKRKAETKPEPKPKPRRKPPVEPPRTAEARPEPAAQEAAPGVATGSVGGQADGVAGGVVGGFAGGVVGGTGSEPVPASGVANPPTLVHRVPPAYPDDARRRDVEGLVVVSAVLDRDGRIEADSLKVVRSIPLLDAAALSAVRQWRFRPARDQQGRTVRVLLEVPIRFVLRG